MNDQWRSAAVVALCQSMKNGRDYNNLPILADALEDAGCTDQDLLSACRNEKEKLLAERIVNLVQSKQTAGAVEWMEKLAIKFLYDYEDYSNANLYLHTMKAAEESARTGYYCWGSDEGSQFFYNNSSRRKFFKTYTILTGVEITEDDQDGISFRCAC